MLDMKFVRDNLDVVRHMLMNRNNSLNLDGFAALEKRRRDILNESDALKNEKNSTSKKIGELRKAGEDTTLISASVRELGKKISALDSELRDLEENLREILLRIPNMPADDVPVGVDDSQNPEIRRWGTPRCFDFEPKPHWDIGVALKILDFDRASKVTGARFTFYRGLGARLERACINFMMDLHANKHGYTEMLAPYIVNKNSMVGTGQLPKFAEDMFKLEGMDYYLIPTKQLYRYKYFQCAT